MPNEPEVPPEPSTAIVRADVAQALVDADAIVTRRPPALVLAEARAAAVALTQVIAAKKHKVMFNDEQYIENEDWQTIARFYGLTVKIESDQFCTYGDASGFEATAVILDINGVERSRATAMCLNDEENWSVRKKYGYVFILKDGTTSAEEPPDLWKTCVLEPTGKIRDDGSPVMRPKKIKECIGEEKVPLFMLRSMAQTRAASKAFAMILRFVPVLAGMKATPAEELPGAVIVQTDDQGHEVTIPKPAEKPQAHRATGTGPQPPAPANPAPTPAQRAASTKPRTTDPTKKISEPQRKRLFAIAKEYGVSQDDLKTYCADVLHVESSTDILVKDYDAFIDWIKGGSDPSGINQAMGE